MKKKLLVLSILSTILLTGCGHEHTFSEATCTEPKTCTECGETEGEALGHIWIDATCTEPKTCSVCGATDGEALGHTWIEATCTEPKTCSVCGATEGEPLEHKWLDATYDAPKTCELCGLTEGEPLEKTEDEYQGDNPYDKEVTDEEFNAMTPEEKAQQLINDFLKEHAQEGKIDVDVPDGTPYDPSQDGTNPYYESDLPDDLKGDFIH